MQTLTCPFPVPSGHFRRLSLGCAALLLQLFACHAAFADKVYCVNTPAAVYDALNKALASNELSSIKLERGFYQLGQVVGTFKSPLIISGDYVPGTSCTQRGERADTTVLDFGGGSNNLSLTQQLSSPYALVKFDRLTLQHGRALSILVGKSADPPFLGQNDYPGHIVFVHTHVTGFTGGADVGGGGVGLETFNGQVTMIDVLFDRIGGNGCRISYFPISDSSVLLDHVTMDLGNNADFCLNDGTEADHVYEIDNSIFWASDGTTSTVRGLDLNGDTEYVDITFNNSLLPGFAGKAGKFASNNPVTTDPKWINPAAGDYHLQLGASPAINAGTSQVPGGEPKTDLDGNVRVLGNAPDLGAYESPSNNASTFTVTNANDDGVGSLRQAMTQANASASPVTSILFNIPGGCPQVINLASPLPDIKVPMQIEGYSQPGSFANTDAEAFTATLCVVVQPGASFGTGNGFHVAAGVANANAALTLTGIGLGSFYRGVSLQGGNYHRILGNQFGGLINQGVYSLSGANGLFGSPNSAIYVNMDAQVSHVQIGGEEPAYRNAIQNAHNVGIGASAIMIGPSVQGTGTSCQIDGNLIGVIDDGTDTAGNDYGIMLQGSGCLVEYNRLAGNFLDAIWINGGNSHRLRRNVIGLLPYGFNLAAVNGGVGIRIGGNDNVIGGGKLSGAPLEDENTIEFMQGPGIVVQTGEGNAMRGNTIVYNNNGANGGDIDIDLNADGPTANDLTDLDLGANQKLNFPVLHALAWTVPPQAGTMNVPATVTGTLRTRLVSGFYQIDAYWADDCHPDSRRGSAQAYVGGIGYVYVDGAKGVANFSVPVTIPAYAPSGNYLSVTATSDTTDYGTSELSTCFNTDTVFTDNLEGF